MLWITAIVVLVSLGAPLWLSLILFGLNAFIPDMVPFADEFVQGCGIASKIKNVNRVSSLINWITENKYLALIVFIGATFLVVRFI